MTNGVQAPVTVNAGQTATATLNISGDLRFCHTSGLILFETASSFVDSANAGHLLAFREVLDRVRHAPPGELLVVVGHTDEIGSPSSNDQLSQRRADSVLAVLNGNVAAWETIFQLERSNAWGDANFRTMITNVTGNSPTQTEINQHRELSPAGEQRRSTLFTQYFAVLLGNPGQSVSINGLIPPTLACGERHILGPGNHAPSRRAEIFFFRGDASPLVSCDEYPKWLTPCQLLPPTTPTVTIASVDKIRQGAIESIQIAVDPSPLPLAVNITLELSTTSGTGEAQFVSTSSSTMQITQSQAVRVRAVTRSSALDNIRLTARVTGQATILAQEDFTVISATSDPAITLASPIVVVKKAHTNPARQTVTLRVDPLSSSFVGTGTFTRSNDRVRFFTAASGGVEIIFNGTDNTFTDAQLNIGVTLFAEGNLPNDVQLELALQATGATPAGPPATVTMTAVALTLNIAEPRTSPGVDPPLLSQSDKVNVGRFLLVQDGKFNRERAMLIVSQPDPPIPNDLVLTPGNAQVALFATENPRSPAPPQTALTLPHTIAGGSVPATGARFFIEGKTASGVFRETGFSLGIAGLEPEGDRIAVTVLGGDPSQAGLFKVGEHEYTEADEGTFDLPRPGAAGVTDDPSVIDPPPPGTPTFTIRRRAVVRYPADTNGADVPVSVEQTSYPMVVILHGNHRRFLDDGVTFVESYRGLEYLARHLATHGYIALTIDVDDINSRGDGIFHRGAAILEHIRIMETRNSSGPPAPGKVDFTGKVDLSQIGLVGHSRGGEGVLAAEQINVARGLGRNINAIVSIAPTNFNDIALTTTPLLLLYGSSDGDVSGADDGVNPFLIYDRAAPLKAMIFVYAAIHNRFSTNADWLDPRFIDNDDARIISEADHQNIAKGYAAAFFERNFRGRTGFDTFFKSYEKLASVSSVELHQQVQDPTRLVLDDYEQPAPNLAKPLLEQLADRAPTNTLGKAVSATGLATPSASLGGPFINALTETLLSRGFVQFFVHDGEGAMVAWGSSGALYETILDGLDASTFAVLVFRVTQRLGSARNPSGAAQDFTVRLTDSAGAAAAVLVSTVTNIPFPFERHDHASLHGPLPSPATRFVDALPDEPALSKSALKSVRLPLESFKAVNASLNLASLQKLEFVFDRTGSGEIAVDEIEFSN